MQVIPWKQCSMDITKREILTYYSEIRKCDHGQSLPWRHKRWTGCICHLALIIEDDANSYFIARKNEPGVFILLLALIIERTHKRIKPFFPNAAFLYPWKHQKTVRFFWCFQWVEKGSIGNKWVNHIFSFFISMSPILARKYS